MERQNDESESIGTPQAAQQSSESQWDPDGVDLAKALLARARAEGRGRRPRRADRGNLQRRSNRGRLSATSGWSSPAADERDPQPLGAAVRRLSDEHGWDENLSVHGVIARWDELVGTEIAQHVRPESYEDAVLTVRASSSAWATQVRLLASELVRKLNVAVGHGTVSEVRVLGPQSATGRRGPRWVRGPGPRDTYG